MNMFTPFLKKNAVLLLVSTFFLVMLSLSILSLQVKAANTNEVVVYSSRNEQLIKPVFDQYTKETGVNVRFVTDKVGPLLARLKSEGQHTRADLLITVDAGNLWFATQSGLLQPIESASLDRDVPEHLRDPEKNWFGLSVRARTMFYNTQQVTPEELSTYQALGEPQWAGRLCLRTSKKVYNQSLVAMLIANEGEAETEKVVSNWVDNLATPPFSNDSKMLEAVASGLCAVGIANTYYYGRLMKKHPELPLGIFWANQATDGVHVNVAGAGVTHYAKNRQAAIALLEWMASAKAQKLFADDNLEYPVNPAVKPADTVAAWGEFKPNLINVSEAGERQVQAVKLMDRAGYK